MKTDFCFEVYLYNQILWRELCHPPPPITFVELVSDRMSFWFEVSVIIIVNADLYHFRSGKWVLFWNSDNPCRINFCTYMTWFLDRNSFCEISWVFFLNPGDNNADLCRFSFLVMILVWKTRGYLCRISLCSMMSLSNQFLWNHFCFETHRDLSWKGFIEIFCFWSPYNLCRFSVCNMIIGFNWSLD